MLTTTWWRPSGHRAPGPQRGGVAGSPSCTMEAHPSQRRAHGRPAECWRGRRRFRRPATALCVSARPRSNSARSPAERHHQCLGDRSHGCSLSVGCLSAVCCLKLSPESHNTPMCTSWSRKSPGHRQFNRVCKSYKGTVCASDRMGKLDSRLYKVQDVKQDGQQHHQYHKLELSGKLMLRVLFVRRRHPHNRVSRGRAWWAKGRVPRYQCPLFGGCAE